MPSPSDQITDETYRLWEDCTVPGKRLGGFFARKPGYHNTRAGNLSTNYSVRLTLDKQGPSDKCAAWDLTLGATQMRQVTTRLQAASLRADDPRTDPLREFYGTLDGSNVYGLIHDSLTGTWRRSSSDSSHLWHVHMSIFRAYVADWSKLDGVLSVVNGETLAQWNARRNAKEGIMLVKYGDGKNNGMDEEVKFYQRRLARLGFDPGAFDGEYGNKMQAAVTASRAEYGYGNPGAREITGTHAERLDDEVAKLAAAQATGAAKVQMKQALEDAIAALPSFPGTITLDLPDVLTVPTNPVDRSGDA